MKETLTNSKGITNEIILYIPYTNNQCNLLDSFYAENETSFEKPEGGRVQENSSSDGNIISLHLFLFSEMSLDSELTNSQGVYSDGEIHNIIYDL